MPVTPHVPVIDAAMVAMADDRPTDDRSADVAVDIDITVDVDVPMDTTHVPATDVPTTAMPTTAAPRVSL